MNSAGSFLFLNFSEFFSHNFQELFQKQEDESNNKQTFHKFWWVDSDMYALISINQIN